MAPIRRENLPAHPPQDIFLYYHPLQIVAPDIAPLNESIVVEAEYVLQYPTAGLAVDCKTTPTPCPALLHP